ncbi:MAG: hypothetical protein M1608_17260 [Candidatus Omnitrophica bacterium]|nr:hypothetical protein [Candidatus Omnitrophota bacterium]
MRAKPHEGAAERAWYLIHLAAAGHPVLNDPLYGGTEPLQKGEKPRLALRAVALAYRDPFRHRLVQIAASWAEFGRAYGFDPQALERRPLLFAK